MPPTSCVKLTNTLLTHLAGGWTPGEEGCPPASEVRASSPYLEFATARLRSPHLPATTVTAVEKPMILCIAQAPAADLLADLTRHPPWSSSMASGLRLARLVKANEQLSPSDRPRRPDAHQRRIEEHPLFQIVRGAKAVRPVMIQPLHCSNAGTAPMSMMLSWAGCGRDPPSDRFLAHPSSYEGGDLVTKRTGARSPTSRCRLDDPLPLHRVEPCHQRRPARGGRRTAAWSAILPVVLRPGTGAPRSSAKARRGILAPSVERACPTYVALARP